MRATTLLQERGVREITLDAHPVRTGPSIFYGDHFSENWRKNQDETERCFWPVQLDITARGEDEEPLAVIGMLRGDWIDCCASVQKYPFILFCDILGQDLYDMADAITTRRGHIRDAVLSIPCRIFYLRLLLLETGYRGRGIGSFLMQHLHNLFPGALNFSYDTLFLTPVPQERDDKREITDCAESDGYDEKRSALVRFYKRTGARFIGGSQIMMLKK